MMLNRTNCLAPKCYVIVMTYVRIMSNSALPMLNYFWHLMQHPLVAN